MKTSSGALANVRFEDFCRVVEAFGYQRDPGAREPPHLLALASATTAELAPMRGQAKPYQIRQFLRAVEEFELKMETA